MPVQPMKVIAGLLTFAGLHLMQASRLAHLRTYCLVVITSTALTAFLVDVALGLAVGLIAEVIRNIASSRRTTT